MLLIVIIVLASYIMNHGFYEGVLTDAIAFADHAGKPCTTLYSQQVIILLVMMWVTKGATAEGFCISR